LYQSVSWDVKSDTNAAVQDGGLSDSDEEDDYIYNPLKLPLGWDGKPIPYWLYKLHGLNQEFKCEICGGQSYWGRRAFERHFREARHQNGMRVLGIPNTKNFYEVTQIEDAQRLWKNIQVGGSASYVANINRCCSLVLCWEQMSLKQILCSLVLP
jgi:splicing factor 3A subunit 3